MVDLNSIILKFRESSDTPDTEESLNVSLEDTDPLFLLTGDKMILFLLVVFPSHLFFTILKP